MTDDNYLVMPIPEQLPYHEGQRVRVRGRIWEVEGPITQAEDAQVLPLRDVANPANVLTLISSVERIEPLPLARLPKVLGDYARWRDLHRAILCTMQPPPGMLGGLDQAKMATEDYQLVPLIRAFERPLQRILIADDVGLGKTIEAILVLLELQARARAQRILVVCPAGLQDQWQDELRDKAGLDFDVFADSKALREVQQGIQIGRNPWAFRRHIITSIDFVKRYDIKRMLRDMRFDLAIIDEAHYLAETSSKGRVYRTERSRFGQFIADRSDSLILLTATPHTGDRQSLFSLVNLVDPTLLASPDELATNRIKAALVRRYKRDIYDAHGNRRFKDIRTQTLQVDFANEDERKLYESVVRYCERRWKRERDTAVGFAMTVIKKRLISSRYSLTQTLEHRLENLTDQPIDVNTKRGVLADYRAGAPLTEAQQAEAERQVLAAPPGDPDDRAKERKELARLIERAKRIPESIDSKAERLLQELEALNSGMTTGTREKVIVFTEYRDTHDFLQRFLRDNGYAHPIATLTGAMSREQRRAQLEAFARPETMLLLATDAASEGLNLQEHCRTVLHYELPWNPNRLEQRNGRVYRWGQARDVIACNLAYTDTYEAHVLDVLLEKTDLIRKDLGSASDVIGVMESISWEELLMAAPASQGASAQAEAARARSRIDREIVAARDKLLAWRDSELGNSVAFDGNERERIERARAHGAARRLSPDERRSIVEWIVPQFGGHVARRGDGTVTLEIPQGLRRNVPAKLDAAYAYDDALRNRDIELLGMHHPLLLACGVAARAALYDPASPLVKDRLAAKIADVANPGILYTFAARYTAGDGAPVAEEIAVVFAPFGLPCSDDAAVDEALFTASPLTGSVAPESPILRNLLDVVDANLERAEAEAARRAIGRATDLEREERRRAGIMLEELDRWSVAKREWLEQQLRLPPKQMTLELDEGQSRQERLEHELFERQRRRLQQELETLEQRVLQRRELIAGRGRVLPPARLELIGALLLIPSYEAER